MNKTTILIIIMILVAVGVEGQQTKDEEQQKWITAAQKSEPIQFEAKDRGWFTYDSATFNWDNTKQKWMVTIMWSTVPIDDLEGLNLNSEIIDMAKKLQEIPAAQITPAQTPPQQPASPTTPSMTSAPAAPAGPTESFGIDEEQEIRQRNRLGQIVNEQQQLHFNKNDWIEKKEKKIYDEKIKAAREKATSGVLFDDEIKKIEKEAQQEANTAYKTRKNQLETERATITAQLEGIKPAAAGAPAATGTPTIPAATTTAEPPKVEPIAPERSFLAKVFKDDPEKLKEVTNLITKQSEIKTKINTISKDISKADSDITRLETMSDDNKKKYTSTQPLPGPSTGEPAYLRDLAAFKLDKAKKEQELKQQQEQYAQLMADMRAKQFEAESYVKNTITIMRGLMNSYDQYSGFARFGSMFLTGDNWATWRNEVNKVLCDTIILGGKQCWVSKVCDQYIDATPGGNSLIARTPGGPKAVVNLQAERSLPIQTPAEGTQFIYKLTYTITNPHDKPMNYNLRFHTKDGTYTAFTPDKEITAGGTDGKTGSQAFYKQSNKDYTQTCLVWYPSIETWDKRSVSEFCEPITQYQGGATNPYTNLPTQPGTCSDKLQNQGETATDCGGPCPACGTATKPKEFEGF